MTQGRMRGECVIVGPAGTGKTYPILLVIHRLARDYRNLRILVLRATRTSLNESVLETYEGEVLAGTRWEALAAGRNRANRRSYDYPSGSRIVLGGLDRNASRILSTAWDIIYSNECIEISEEVWETLASRMARPGRDPRFGWMLGDTNPGAPTHWLKQRNNAGKLTFWNTVHEANPRLYDGHSWTDEGKRYLRQLEQLSGVRYLRLRQGVWAGAEGQIYDEWDEGAHLVAADTLPARFPRYVAGVDWGYTNPGVIQVWGLDGDGRMYRVHEVYQTGRQIDWWVEKAREVRNRYKVEWFACDPSEPGFIAAFRTAGLHAQGAKNAVMMGVQAVQMRLKTQPDGKPRLFMVRGACADRDSRLNEAKKPTCTEEEIAGYVWAPPVNGRAPKEEPLKVHDHGVDCLRYVVAEVDGLGHYSAGAF